MAKAYSFDEGGAKRIVKAVKAFEANPQSFTGGSAGSQGYAPLNVWLEIVDYDGSPNENNYTVNVYKSPYGGTAIATGKKAWNNAELGNSSAGGCGYEFVTSDPEPGDIIGLLDIPTNCRYRALQYLKRNDDWGYVFHERLDPDIHEECPEDA